MFFLKEGFLTALPFVLFLIVYLGASLWTILGTEMGSDKVAYRAGSFYILFPPSLLIFTELYYKLIGNGQGSYLNSYRLALESFFYSLRLYVWGGIWLGVLGVLMIILDHPEDRRLGDHRRSSVSKVVNRGHIDRIPSYVGVGALGFCVLLFVIAVWGEIYNSKNRADYYTGATTFVIEGQFAEDGSIEDAVRALPDLLRATGQPGEGGKRPKMNSASAVWPTAVPTDDKGRVQQLVPGHTPGIPVQAVPKVDYDIMDRGSPLAGARNNHAAVREGQSICPPRNKLPRVIPLSVWLGSPLARVWLLG